jgi:hypothetical protein
MRHGKGCCRLRLPRRELLFDRIKRFSRARRMGEAVVTMMVHCDGSLPLARCNYFATVIDNVTVDRDPYAGTYEDLPPRSAVRMNSSLTSSLSAKGPSRNKCCIECREKACAVAHNQRSIAWSYSRTCPKAPGGSAIVFSVSCVSDERVQFQGRFRFFFGI